MKKSHLTFYYFFFITLSVVFFIALCGTATFSKYIKHQKKKSNYLISQEINNKEREILIVKKQLAELKIKESTSSNKNSIADNNKFNSLNLKENSLLNSINFENEVKDDLASIEHQAAIKKALLPCNFFSEIEQKIVFSNKTEKAILYKQKQWLILKYILQNIILFPKSKIEKFELRSEVNNDYPDNKTLPLGSLFISITTRENYFQKLFNNIINSEYFFVISSIAISNSNPFPPLHHDTYLKDHLLPILGTETITVTLKIDLFDIDNISLQTLQGTRKDSNTFPTKKLLWEHQKGTSPLFVSRHYATKNELLIDPIEYPQTLCPPVSNEWLANNNLDYSNPNILFEDSNQTGFNNLEKWLGDNPQEEPGKFSSDPNDPTSHPLLWTKLKCYQKEMTSEVHSIYFLGLESRKNRPLSKLAAAREVQGASGAQTRSVHEVLEDASTGATQQFPAAVEFGTRSNETLFQIQPNTALRSKNRQNKAIFDKKIRYLKMGEQIEGLPYKIINYQEKRIVYKKTSYDCSELIIENLNTKEQLTLIKKSPYHPLPTQLTNITAIKIENTLFNPPHVIAITLGEYFSLDYILQNSGLANKQNVIESENYRLVEIKTQELTIEKDSIRYKIPVISATK